MAVTIRHELGLVPSSERDRQHQHRRNKNGKQVSSNGPPLFREVEGHRGLVLANQQLWGGNVNRTTLWQQQDDQRAAEQDKNEGAYLAALLRDCAKNKDLCRGTRIHDRILERGLLENYTHALLIMYAKCGVLGKARALHDMCKSTDIITWNTLIEGFAQQGQGQDALDYFDRMQQEGIVPDALTYVSVLKACGTIGAMERGKQLHNQIERQGLLQTNIVLATALVGMYCKCVSFSTAQSVLEEFPFRDVVSWNTLMAASAQKGKAEQALICFLCMRHEGIRPNAVTYTCILKACGAMRDVDKGKQIHDQIVKQGLLKSHVVLGNAVVDMYTKCGALSKAKRVFEMLPSRNVISWSTLIAGYAQEGQADEALRCFECMQREGIAPNAVTYICILKACAAAGAADQGKQVHAQIVRQGFLRHDITLGNALVGMYAKCGALSKAHTALEELPVRNTVSWNTLIAGYAQEGQGDQGLICFECMQYEGVSPNTVTYICALQTCGVIHNAEKGKQIHNEIMSQGFLKNEIELGIALVDMYAKCGDISMAQKVHGKLPSQNVISWSALILGYVNKGHSQKALNCFECMQQEGIQPNAVTYMCLLKACGAMAAIDKGEQIYDQIVRRGLLSKDIALANALLDMYVKCGDLIKAKNILERLPARNIVSWSALIAGYAKKDQGEEALYAFGCMQQEGILPNMVTYISVMKACSSMGAADKGKQIHDQIVREGLWQSDIMVGNALVGMYAWCGALSRAQCVFEELPSRNVVSWNTLIAGYSQEGQCEQLLACLEHMQHEGILLSNGTFGCALNLCSHLGLVEEAHVFFVSMSTEYDLKPDLECYTCMVDLFGRAGHLDWASRMIQEMPSCVDVSIWHALLGACQKWGDVRAGRWAFEQALQADGSDTSAYVLMGNIHAVVGMDEKPKYRDAIWISNRI